MSTVFLDRDGVINEKRPDYVKNWHEFHFLPGACEAIAALTAAGHRIVVCTNQAGIAKGLISTETIEDIHQHMLSTIERAGGRVEKVYYCPHSKHEGCDCRKPRPGLLFRAYRELDLDPNGAVFIGDSMTDAQAGIAAGVRPILVLTGLAYEQLRDYPRGQAEPFLVAADLYQAALAVLCGRCLGWRYSPMSNGRVCMPSFRNGY